MMFTGVDDLPQLLHSKKMQRLVSDKTYKAKSKKIRDKYHLDVATPEILNAKRANNLASKVGNIVGDMVVIILIVILFLESVQGCI